MSTLHDSFYEIANRYNDRACLRYKEDGTWFSLTYAEVESLVKKLARILTSEGIVKGDRVGIWMTNCKEWAFIDLACLTIGAVVVPIYPDSGLTHVEYIINHASLKMLFVRYSAQAETIKEIETQIEKIIFIEGSGSYENVIEFLKFMEKEVRSDVEISIKDEDLATIVYTSGTTGKQKGVMLSHKNILSNVLGAKIIIPVNENDELLSFLPLSHIFERMAGYYVPLLSGSCICYAQSVQTVADDIKEVRPTLLIGVPRFYEKFYDKVNNTIESGSFLKRKLFNWAMNVGQKSAKEKNRSSIQFKLAKKLVFDKLQEKLGGRLRFAVSGGAPLSQEIAEFFESLNIIILEGYGMTECSPVITCNTLDKYKLGSVGMPLENVEIKLGVDGELLVKGPNVTSGYYKDPELTIELFDKEGFLKTGDLAEIDAEGFVKIIDRKKDILVTSYGKNVAPAHLETAIQTSELVENVILIGDRRKYISALIYPNFDMLKKYAETHGITFEHQNDLLAHKEIYKYMESEINRIQKDANRFEQVKKFKLIDSPFTIERDELTPKLSIKRKNIILHYEKEIEELYSE